MFENFRKVFAGGGSEIFILVGGLFILLGGEDFVGGSRSFEVKIEIA